MRTSSFFFGSVSVSLSLILPDPLPTDRQWFTQLSELRGIPCPPTLSGTSPTQSYLIRAVSEPPTIQRTLSAKKDVGKLGFAATVYSEAARGAALTTNSCCWHCMRRSIWSVAFNCELLQEGCKLRVPEDELICAHHCLTREKEVNCRYETHLNNITDILIMIRAGWLTQQHAP